MRELGPLPDNVIPFPRTVRQMVYEDVEGIYRLEVDDENPLGEDRHHLAPDALLAQDEPISIDVYRRSELHSPDWPPEAS